MKCRKSTSPFVWRVLKYAWALNNTFFFLDDDDGVDYGDGDGDGDGDGGQLLSDAC